MQSPKTFPIQQEEATQEQKVTGREEEGSPIAVDIDKRRPLPSPNVGRPLHYPEESKPVPPSTTTQEKRPLPYPEESKPAPPSTTTQEKRPLPYPEESKPAPPSTTTKEKRPLPYPEESKPAPPSTTTQQKKPLPLHEMIPLPNISTSENLPSPSTLAIYTEIPEIPEECVHNYSNVPRTLDGYLKPQCEQCGIRQAKGEETATNTKI